MSNNSSQSRNCDGWCAPTIIFLILSAAGMLMRALVGASNLAIFSAQGLYVAFWTSIMYYLCSICRSGWSWVILLFPLILGLIGFFILETMLLGEALKGGMTRSSENDVNVQRDYRIYY